MTKPRRTDLPLYIYASLLSAPLLWGTAIGQANPASPPGHLPRFIWQCEAGAGAPSATCSVWNWQGSSYSATWSIGAIGQISVISSDRGEITLKRQDTSGSLAGLSATYTAKYDGARFTDGKMNFTIKGASNTGVWNGALLLTPVVHTAAGMVRTVTDDEIYGVGRGPVPYYNWYSADLTAYAVYSHRYEGAGNTVVVEDFRVRGEQPMKPGERRSLSLHAKTLPVTYEGEATSRPGMAIAALYTDGSAFGDPKVVAAMVAFRRSMRDALTGIGTTLCELGGQGASIAEVDAALDKQHAAEDSRSSSDKGARESAYTFTSKSLHARGARSASQSIKRTFEALDTLRTGLSDPVKNGSGERAMSAVSPLSCRLP